MKACAAGAHRVDRVVTATDPATHPGGHTRFAALDSLRGIAALGVAAYHIHGDGLLFNSALVRSGWLWVDFFFVLSGFVIAASYGERLAGGFAVRRFMLLRLGRIYPLHIAVLALYLGIELVRWGFQPQGWSLNAPFAGLRSPEYLVASTLLIQTFLTNPSAWNPQSWSIAVEVWLYLAAALLWRSLGGRAWIAALVAALAAGVLILAQVTLPVLTWGVLRGIAGFGLGIACWHWRGRLPGGTLAELLCLLAIAAVYLLPLAEPAPLADFAFAATVLVFARERGAISRVLLQRWALLLGTLSYSLYMVHVFVIARGMDGLRLIGLGSVTLVDGVPYKQIVAAPWLADVLGVGLIAACVPVAWLTWRFIEWPARAWSRRRAEAMGVIEQERSAPTI